MIEAKKASDEEDLYGDHISKSSSSTTAEALVMNEEVILRDYEAAANNYCRSSSTSSFYMDYDPPVVEVESGADNNILNNDNNNNDNMSFVYDTTTNFSNDSLLDFLGGSAMSTNYSRNGGLESFGSVDNLCLDDYY